MKNSALEGRVVTGIVFSYSFVHFLVSWEVFAELHQLIMTLAPLQVDLLPRCENAKAEYLNHNGDHVLQGSAIVSRPAGCMYSICNRSV